MEHVAGVWVTAGGVSQSQETVESKWCYEAAPAPVMQGLLYIIAITTNCNILCSTYSFINIIIIRHAFTKY